ncbi:hypothetical protein AA983_10310 [Dermacoccus sp. PE3]|uniref:ACT domain-containing protein n=1 Tax=Dermacoccus sp. PE3 TaxID=1641401 RepID=UPI00064244D7|nr:ACT domain-containing protein [Dermacoccus sp. PE3]KLO62822.1 hypothetical protein AA983_10310 [Dermacoccus sp. PE3]
MVAFGAQFTLIAHPEELSYVRLGPHEVVPDWALTDAPLVSVSATASETSVLCLSSAIPRDAVVRQQGPFNVFEVDGPLDFALTGLLSAIVTPLGEAELTVFTVSTFDTDWIMVPTFESDRARGLWKRAGHIIKEKE